MTTLGGWCDDSFQNAQATVVCETLGYSQAICYAREACFGHGVVSAPAAKRGFLVIMSHWNF